MSSSALENPPIPAKSSVKVKEEEEVEVEVDVGVVGIQFIFNSVSSNGSPSGPVITNVWVTLNPMR